MIHEVWLAMTVTGLLMFDTSQQACIGAAKAGSVRVHRLLYMTDDESYCCEKKFKTLGFQQQCKDNPDFWNCETKPPKLFAMDCVTSPAFTTVDAVEKAK